MNAISPELALVDPELAAAARALLPEPGRFRPAFRPASRPRSTPAAIVPARLPRPPAASPARAQLGASRFRVPRRTAVVVISIACAVATTVGLAYDAASPRLTAVRGENARLPQGVLHTRAARQAEIARTYTWPAVPGARTYRIALIRAGRLIYKTTTSRPSVELPARIHLEPGRYTWRVTAKLRQKRPGSATRTTVEATFQVPRS